MQNTLIAIAIIMTAGNFSVAVANDQFVTVKINGMVCAFCAQGIMKKFKNIEAVDTVKVDLDNKVVKLTIKRGQVISDDAIKEAVTDSGFNLETVERTQP